MRTRRVPETTGRRPTSKGDEVTGRGRDISHGIPVLARRLRGGYVFYPEEVECEVSGHHHSFERVLAG